MLPQSHLDELKVVTTTGINVKRCKGYTLPQNRGIDVDYDKNNLNRIIEKDNEYLMYDGNDLMIGENEFKGVLIHEIAHNTERIPKKYSTLNKFRDLFGWNHADHHLGTRKDRK